MTTDTGDALREAAQLLVRYAADATLMDDRRDAERLAPVLFDLAGGIDRLVELAAEMDPEWSARIEDRKRRRRRRGPLGLIPMLALLVGVGCVPYQSPPAPAAPVVTSDVFADSMGAQMQAQGLTDDDPHRQWKVMNGATVVYWAYEIAGAVNDPNAQVVTLALGGNDAAPWGDDGGWTASDEQAWWDTLAWVTSHKCAVVVLPWMTEQVEQWYPGSLASVDRARAWFAEAAALLPRLVVADWRDVVVNWTGDTPVMADDGVHLGSAPAAEARYALIINAETRC
jgi:hypothetical protein